MNKQLLRKNVLYILVCTATIVLSSAASLQAQMQRDVMVNAIFERYVYLTAGNKVQFETRNLSQQCDPVLNLISPRGVEVAANDNGAGGFAARITYTPPASGYYTLIVRARSTARSGTADIYKNNAQFQTNVAFGGRLLILANLRNKESIQTVKLPRGDNGSHRIYLLNVNEVNIVARGANTAAGNAAILKLTTTPNTNKIIVGSTGVGGMLRLIRNDAAILWHDPDQDGLGTELETELGSCSFRSGFAKGFDCRLVADPRDTDGDGISDGWEVLGRSDITPTQPLPKWGANPRHKDLFIEVDFMRRTSEENTGNVNLKMSPASARQFAAIYADSFTVSPLLKLYHATILQNPDLVPGISAHLDIGLEPASPADATIYGNWGGFNAVNAIVSGSDYIGLDPNVAWKTNLREARLGIFRYALGYSSGGGSCGNTYACAFNFQDNFNPAHEYGHTLGLGHSGPYGATGNVDPNCKPNYASHMNYAFYGQSKAGFSDGNGAPALNNASLKEWKAVSPSKTLYLDVLEKIFRYWVDRTNGHVDWNRNGVFEPEGQTVRAYANYRPGAACEYTRYNKTIINGAQTTTTPILARMGNRLYMFYTNGGTLKYKYSTSTWNCPEPGTAGCANGTWSSEKNAGMLSVGVDVANDGNGLRVVSVEWSGKIMEKRLQLDVIFNREVWTSARQIPGSAQGEPSISYTRTSTYLVYKGTDLLIHFNKWVNGRWQGDRIAYSAANTPVKSTSQWAFPAIIQTYLPWKPGVKSLYALVPAADAKLDLWYYNPATNLWELTNVIEGGRVGPIHSKPSMAYVPYRGSSETPGRVYMVYIKQSQPGAVFNGQVRMKMSYVKTTLNPDSTYTKEEKIGLDSYFDNSWFYAYGMSLYFDRGQDTNLRAVSTIGSEENKLNVVFRPKADGINDFSYTNYNDWEVLRLNLCKQVVNPGGLVSNPINCTSATLPQEAAIEATQREEKATDKNPLKVFPNPFFNNVQVSFSLPVTQVASVKIYDLQGIERATLFQGEAQANQTYPLEWQASHKAAGIYLLQLQTPGKRYQQRLLLAK
ncbi:T9SS type A sorting domain-containing protein [Adhaeribacter radiodurans]|uniref:T9SS type A sorting domain-containing protein n=1 Tax=Adhaeribacter radiodurans TaxID=2745197 RepID=A0A7L7LCB2_9BACT|nr:T9SS type A sorting domain-containing protein [Adhaeribacter radiodurans]QMU30413.1 T9SS type A sorting domain-containing protein [Adhaeribacter radiodurans]